MKQNRIVTGAAALVAAAGLAIGGVSLANASDNSTSTPSPSSTSNSGSSTDQDRGAPNGNTDPSRPMRSDEQLLTGDTLVKVTAAVKAKEPGATIERVETDSEGVYEAHLVRADGTHITVQVGADFTVTAVQEGGPNGSGGPGGSGGRDGHRDADGDHAGDDGGDQDGGAQAPSDGATSDSMSNPTAANG